MKKNKVAFGLVDRMRKNPYNNRFNLTELGRHAFCLRKSHAGDATALSLRAKPSALARRLIGRYTD
jgi:hypothetical protein